MYALDKKTQKSCYNGIPHSPIFPWAILIKVQIKL